VSNVSDSSANTTTEVYDESAVTESPENYVKLTIIFLKIVYITTMFSFAFVAYYKKKGGLAKEHLIFVFFIIEMISLLIFDLY